MANPRLVVDLTAVAANAGEIVRRARARGITVAGVTKACCGSPRVARAMLAGGVGMLADSRLRNLARLRRAGLDHVPLCLLRPPMPSRLSEAAALADLILVSEPAIIRGLSRATVGWVVDGLLMVDLGDLREGLWPDRLPDAVRKATGLAGFHLAGLGTNLTCFGGVKPTSENLGRLVDLAAEAGRIIGGPLGIVSGGNSSSLSLLWADGLPAGINHLRIGEGILLGVETIDRRPLPGLRQDAFKLVAEVIEIQKKPSLPVGEIAQDAFGRTPIFTDRGWERRAILAVGRQDCVPEGLVPIQKGLDILGGSSDHLIVADRGAGLALGDEVGFIPNYASLLAAMTSPYVAKDYIPRTARNVVLE